MVNNSEKVRIEKADVTEQIHSILDACDHEQLADILYFTKRLKALPGCLPEAKQLLETLSNMGLPNAVEYVQDNPPSAGAIVLIVELEKDGMRRDQARKESDKNRAIADARHGKPGGSREKSGLMKKAWASGIFSSRDVCAEIAGKKNGMLFSTARKALRNTLDPSPWPAKPSKN